MSPQLDEPSSSEPSREESAMAGSVDELKAQAKTKDDHEHSESTICSEVKSRDICRQVDYYFSDENLEKDTFLKKRMKGSKNKPIPLHIIASFAKMQRFKPIEHIIGALEHSMTVNVLYENGTPMLQRKEVFHQTQKKASAAAVGPAKKARAATGFEQYFADAPMTPADSKEEEDLYGVDVPIAMRFEAAVRRYRSRRKFDSFANNVFQKWMAFGGVHIGTSPFQTGPDPAELEEMTAAQKKDAKTKVYVNGGESDDYGEPIWDVNFTALAKAFLSRRLPEVIELDTEERVNLCIDIMQNFYRYLLYHKVCPEYEHDIEAAKELCEVARQQLYSVHTLQKRLPGPFNIAASTLFGGEYSNLYADDQRWAHELKSDEYSIGQSYKDAKQRFITGVVALGLDKADPSQPAQPQVMDQEVKYVWEGVGMEIVKIGKPTAEMLAFYEALKSAASPLGVLICRPWTPPEFAANDLPNGVSGDEAPSDKYTVMLEENLLVHCREGMRLQATVRQLTSGMQFIDQVVEVACTFDTLLDNELLIGHKEVHWYTREELREREGAGEGGDEPGEDAELDSD